MKEGITAPASGGEAKVDQYVRRIRDGESMADIFKGLPASFRTGIEAKLGLSTEHPSNQPEKSNGGFSSIDTGAGNPLSALQEVRSRLGMSEAGTNISSNARALEKLQIALKKRGERSGRQLIFEDLYRRIAERNDSAEIVQTLAGEIYNELRIAEYPIPEGYNQAWNKATQDNSLKHQEQNSWVY